MTAGRMTNAEFKAQREALGLTSRDVAELFGVRQATVTSWEAGIRPIPDRRAVELRDLSAKFYRQAEDLAQGEGDVIKVPRNDGERADGSMPARWQRQAALVAARESGKRIEYTTARPRGRGRKK